MPFLIYPTVLWGGRFLIINEDEVHQPAMIFCMKSHHVLLLSAIRPAFGAMVRHF